MTATKDFVGYNEDDVDCGIGRIKIDRDTFDVYMDENTGRLWYDDERAY